MNKESICSSLRPLREKVAEGRMRGFTLIELLVVVMIIAILAAIAVPQYKHAVLKSRFSTVMPMAKAIADAQEVYYQGRQLYALDVDELDVTPVNAENTSVSLSQTDGYDYVMAQNSQVPGAHYIIYQKYSENYPSEIHCEAENDNADAQWLCSTLSNNNSIGTTITGGYTTYVINGTGAGFPPAYIALMERVDCTGAEAMGFTCTSDAETGTKKICMNGFCRTKIYNEDGSYTTLTCQADSNGVCISGGNSATYDANGNNLSTHYCTTIAQDGSCTYDTAYEIRNIYYTYDSSGNILTSRNCKTVATDGSCSEYGGGYDYVYDANGNNIAQRACTSGNVASNGSCSQYGSADVWTYDANGNQLTYRVCLTFLDDGSCSLYYSGRGSNPRNYTYDDNGNMLTQRYCTSVAESNGSCSSYEDVSNYTYDANGNRLTARRCSSFDSNWNCTSYKSGGSDYTYDGNKVIQKNCSAVNSSGKCTSYSSSTVLTYDDNGQTISYQSCSGSNINTNTGACTAYNSAGTYSK